jgi:hypothetical protein
MAINVSNCYGGKCSSPELWIWIGGWEGVGTRVSLHLYATLKLAGKKVRYSRVMLVLSKRGQ